MTSSPFGPRRIRSLLRVLHLVLAVATGVLLYMRHGISDAVARDLMAYVIFPLLFVTGGVMWQQARLRRLLRGPRVSAPDAKPERANAR